MKRVIVDFNDEEPYGAWEGHCGKLLLGEQVIAYTGDDDPPFGHQGTVVKVRPAIEDPIKEDPTEFYWIKLDEDTPWLEGKELGLGPDDL
jgi:hypothetical protein